MISLYFSRDIYVHLCSVLGGPKREVIDEVALREKSVKYYGSILTSAVDVALLGSTRDLSEENKVSTYARDVY